MRRWIIIFAIGLPILGSADLLAPTPGQKATNHQNKSMSKQPLPTISENNYGGRMLVLSNNDTWEVYKKDTDRSGGWINGEIMVEKQTSYRREGDKYFRYKLYNTATKDSVWARPFVEENGE